MNDVKQSIREEIDFLFEQMVQFPYDYFDSDELDGLVVTELFAEVIVEIAESLKDV